MIETKIELAPEKYWIECTWPEIKVYLFCLNIDGKMDWRLPTDPEQAQWHPKLKPECWTVEDELGGEYYTQVGLVGLLVPVRDLKDD